MASTVNNAFNEFMKNIVNLDPNIVYSARKSRDNLLSNISEFNNQEDFFTLCSKFNVHFGSFSRKTKCRELDDIDLMIGIAANGATYNSNDPWDDMKILSNTEDPAQKVCTRDDGTLNSTKVINKFKKKLENVREYSHSDIHRNGEAVVLNLISKEWSFDIVPCFHTVTEDDGRDYYLIPNGKGNWKKTDPRKDKEHITTTNQNKDGQVLELVRLVKKWNQVNNNIFPSYLLETIIINFCDSQIKLDEWIDVRFRKALEYIAENITKEIYDLKDIQGNINSLSTSEQQSIKNKVQADFKKALTAAREEDNHNQKEAMEKWGEIFGKEFPKYSE